MRGTASGQWGRAERHLWRRRDEGDPWARERLVALHLPIARRLARRYAGVREPYDDLLQVASLALVQAVDRFDPAAGTPFAGFARPTILGELKRHLRDKVWTVRVPRPLHDRLAKIERTIEEMTAERGSAPTVSEIAGRLGVAREEVLEALEAERNRRTASLDAPAGDSEDDSVRLDSLAVEEPGFELVEDRVALAAALPALDERGLEVLRLRFGEELSQRRIATLLGTSPMSVSRLLRRSLKELREAAA